MIFNFVFLEETDWELNFENCAEEKASSENYSLELENHFENFQKKRHEQSQKTEFNKIKLIHEFEKLCWTFKRYPGDFLEIQDKSHNINLSSDITRSSSSSFKKKYL